MKLSHGQRAAIYFILTGMTSTELSERMGVSKQRMSSMLNEWKRESGREWSKKNQQRAHEGTAGTLNLNHPSWAKIEALLEKMKLTQLENEQQPKLPLEEIEANF